MGAAGSGCLLPLDCEPCAMSCQLVSGDLESKNRCKQMQLQTQGLFSSRGETGSRTLHLDPFK